MEKRCFNNIECSMSRRLESYFRTFRLRSGLTQRELGFLIACKRDTYVSRIERGKRQPTLEATLAYMIMFDTRPPDVIPAVWEELEAGILARAEQLYFELERKPSRANLAKMGTLKLILSRDERTRI
jgi:DNA-binding XRE family transcriptional regulator